MTERKYIILGAGVTGLAAGMISGFPIFEANNLPGGICRSYYIKAGGAKNTGGFPQEEDTYRFENGGGHWIFGSDKLVLKFINSLSLTKEYDRKVAVYFPERDLYIPYPLQNNLSLLPKEIIKKAAEELARRTKSGKRVSTCREWLEANFGKTLCELFFFPFHKLYTAGLYAKSAPQDNFKTPADKGLILKGMRGKTPAVGYNTRFVYPEKGFDKLIEKMASRCNINYNSEVIGINTGHQRISFQKGRDIRYDTVISTIPLNKMLRLARIGIDEPEPPYTSTLVINIGAKKGRKCPDFHWLYIPKSKSGFYRVGFYSNVDRSFLPRSLRSQNDRVSIYVEKCYPQGNKPGNIEIKRSGAAIVRELQEWGFIDTVEVTSCDWIEVAYTWQYPDSKWRQKALSRLRGHNIYQIGRYGKWHFQGILDSIKDGLETGKTFLH